MKFFREKYNRKNVTPEKVLNSYEGSEEFFLSVGRAYIVNALMEHFGLESLEGEPTRRMFDKDVENTSFQEKEEYFNQVIGSFVDQYVFQTAPYVTPEEDFKKNYALSMIYVTVLLLQLKDAAKEGDGERNLIHQKILLCLFKSVNAYSKYAKEMFVSIAQVECLLTPRLSEQFKWSHYVNWLGGEGKNIEDDLSQEITNRIGKNLIQSMGANKTMDSISNIMKSASGIKLVMENYDKNTNLQKKSGKHTKLNTADEEKEMIKDLRKVKAFQHTPGRRHKSFPDIKRFPLQYVKPDELNQWLIHNLGELPQ